MADPCYRLLQLHKAALQELGTHLGDAGADTAQTRLERAQDYRHGTYLYTLRAVLHATGQCIGGGVKNAVDCAYLYFTDAHGFIVIK